MTAQLVQRALACAVLAAAAIASQAQDKVYRCGPDGREYSSTPCASGTAVDVADPRSAAQQRDSRSAAAKEAQLGDQLARERRQREQAAAGQKAAGIGASADKKSGRDKPPAKKRKPKPTKKAEPPQDPSLSPPFKLQGNAPSK